jgi:zinc and cadmium transporter
MPDIIPTEFDPAALWLLLAYSVAIVLASVFGGWLPSLIRFTHTRMQMIISCVGGMMLGVAVFHLLPHALAEVTMAEVHSVCYWMMAGLLVMFFLLRAFHFHQHGPADFGPEEGSHSCESHAHLRSPATPAGNTNEDDSTESSSEELDCKGAECELAEICKNRNTKPNSQTTSSLAGEPALKDDCSYNTSETSSEHDPQLRPNSVRFLAVLSGLGLHTLLDGVAVAAAVQAESMHNTGGFALLGLGVFLAVFLHKPLDAISITSLMQAEGQSRTSQIFVNFGFALMAPLGVLLMMLGVMSEAYLGTHVIAYVMAFSAGVFLCISLSDLLPEMEFHSHNRVRLSLALLAGIGIALAAGWFEPAGMHSHDEGHDHTSEISTDAP